MPATKKDNVSFTDFTNKIIHIILTDLFSTIHIASQIGKSVIGLDRIQQSLHIGILVASLDFLEA
jgi:hypothetical protein